MESVISVVFKVESEAYQALTELRRQPVSERYIVSQAALVKKSGGRIVVEDAFDTGVETNNDTVIGGLIGGLVGILGGPLGMLMTGSVGALTGSIIDAGDAAYNASLLEKVAEQFADGEVGIQRAGRKAGGVQDYDCAGGCGGGCRGNSPRRGNPVRNAKGSPQKTPRGEKGGLQAESCGQSGENQGGFRGTETKTFTKITTVAQAGLLSITT